MLPVLRDVRRVDVVERTVLANQDDDVLDRRSRAWPFVLVLLVLLASPPVVIVSVSIDSNRAQLRAQHRRQRTHGHPFLTASLFHGCLLGQIG